MSKRQRHLATPGFMLITGAAAIGNRGGADGQRRGTPLRDVPIYYDFAHPARGRSVPPANMR
ncbi:MAG: hypothetical protein HOM58_22425 [Rhodospirillaceae bacterium]|nr:hypothetical protein [Rhodospirillaceae bacterium]